MYWQCMTKLKALPKDTIIVEDSHIGREGAMNSGAHLYPVKDAYDLKYDTFMEFCKEFADVSKKKQVPWRNKKMNVLIPMAGAGSRFAQAGYTFPKPLIEVRDKPMIQVVVDNLNVEAHYIFIVLKEPICHTCIHTHLDTHDVCSHFRLLIARSNRASCT